MTVYRCTRAQRMDLADCLGDSPETVIATHLLRCGLCQAYASDSNEQYGNVIVQAQALPGEPMGFGEDAALLWEMLQAVEKWFCINVTTSCASVLGPLIATGLRTNVRYLRDLYYTLTRPVVVLRHEAVRKLEVEDIPMVEAAPKAVQGGCFGSVRALLEEGKAAGAIVNGNLVAIAHVAAQSDSFADIGVATLAPWRGLGFASAAASLVAGELQQAGVTPIWSTGEDNHASQRVAQTLGFSEIGRRMYVILDAGM